MNKSTSWGKVANWYNELLGNKDSYQKTLILPNLLRLTEIKKGELILDLGCGQGFFSREFARLGAKVIGIDISKELIDIAKNHRSNLAIKQLNNSQEIEYHVSSADNLSFLKNEAVDKIIIILALQNIKNVSEVLKECDRVSKPKGSIFIVLNHPAFRIPKKSSWGFDDIKKIQYRRIDSYLSESKEEIQMHPGKKPWEKTISFHRPLQFYFKILKNHGFSVLNLEEWNSPKKSEPGPKAVPEDIARREIPLFLFLQAGKI